MSRPAVQPRDPFAPLRHGDLVESPLRLCTAVGDDKRAHLREVGGTKTLCSRPAVVLDGAQDERDEVMAAGGRRGCSGCKRRAGPVGTLAAHRASQIVARGMRVK